MRKVSLMAVVVLLLAGCGGGGCDRSAPYGSSNGPGGPACEAQNQKEGQEYAEKHGIPEGNGYIPNGPLSRIGNGE